MKKSYNNKTIFLISIAFLILSFFIYTSITGWSITENSTALSSDNIQEEVQTEVQTAEIIEGIVEEVIPEEIIQENY